MKKLKVILSMIIFILFVSNASAASIENITAIDSKIIEVVASPDVTFPNSDIYGDLRVVKDLHIVSSEKDASNTRKITISLSDSLEPNTSYSIISVGLAEGSIEFQLGDDLSGEIINDNILNEEKIIEKVVILNPNTIETYYNYDIKDGMYDFKVLSELPIENIKSTGNNEFLINLNKLLNPSSSYILMISLIEDAFGREVSFSEVLYDFYTSSDLPEDSTTNEGTTPNENISDNNTEENVDLNSAGEVDANTGANTTENNSLDDVAMNANTQPNTGPTTWVLILFTLLIGGIVFTVMNKKTEI